MIPNHSIQNAIGPSSECLKSQKRFCRFFCDVTKEYSAALGASSACAVSLCLCSCGNAVAWISSFPRIPVLPENAPDLPEPGSPRSWNSTGASEPPGLSVCSVSLRWCRCGNAVASISSFPLAARCRCFSACFRLSAPSWQFNSKGETHNQEFGQTRKSAAFGCIIIPSARRARLSQL